MGVPILSMLTMQIGLSREMQFADAFTIQAVEPENLKNFNYMSGYIPFLQNLIEYVSIMHKDFLPIADIKPSFIVYKIKSVCVKMCWSQWKLF